MKKIAFVNQRYGLQVNGGSETYTRQIAEKLSHSFEIEILTTKALSYDKWENYYLNDEEIVDGIKVRRFGVKQKRNSFGQNIVGRVLQRKFPYSMLLGKMWIRYQGPYAPDLIHFIRTHAEEYDLFVFVTYLYYTTVVGMPEVYEKSVFIPTAHDESYVYFPCYKNIFTKPQGIIYLTDEEKKLVEKIFHNESVPNIVAGVGVDLPKDINNGRFRDKYGIDGDYIIYTGRVDQNKNCQEMFDFFIKLQSETVWKNKKIILVVIGKEHMDIPMDKHIQYLGFVSEQDKYDAISGAMALWLPSKNESLSISVLESMSLGVPVIVNGNCEVLKGHCIKSHAGYYYTEYEGFKTNLTILLESNRNEISENAIAYIDKDYNWKIITNKITSFFEYIIGKR